MLYITYTTGWQGQYFIFCLPPSPVYRFKSRKPIQFVLCWLLESILLSISCILQALARRPLVIVKIAVSILGFNRLVVDCFYFTQAITLSLLVYFNSLPSMYLGKPFNSSNYHRVQRSIVYESCCADTKTL